jgi:hypothetical protein
LTLVLPPVPVFPPALVVPPVEVPAEPPEFEPPVEEPPEPPFDPPVPDPPELDVLPPVPDPPVPPSVLLLLLLSLLQAAAMSAAHAMAPQVEPNRTTPVGISFEDIVVFTSMEDGNAAGRIARAALFSQWPQMALRVMPTRWAIGYMQKIR